MKLNEKLKGLSKSGKAWILSATMTMAGIMGAHAQMASTYSSSYNGRTTMTQSTHDKYELKAGVLMPKVGESIQEYEARRIRLSKQTIKLHKRLAENSRRHIAHLKARGSSSRLIEMAEESLQDHLQKAKGYISYYSKEGQKRLKEFSLDQRSTNQGMSRPVPRRSMEIDDF